MAADSPLSVRLRPDVRAALVARAAELDRPVSWVVQRAVEAYVERSVIVPDTYLPSPPVVARGPVGSLRCRRCDWTGSAGSECPEHPGMVSEVRS